MNLSGAVDTFRLTADPVLVMERSAMTPDPWQRDLLQLGARVGRTPFRGLVLTCRQAGKALAVTTPVPTPDGWKPMGELVDGDQVLDEQGRPCKVVEAHPEYVTDCYRVTFTDGTHVDASGEHKWTVLDTYARVAMRLKHPDGPPGNWTEFTYRRGSRHGPFRPLQTRTTVELLAAGLREDRRYTWAIPTAGPLDLPDADLPVDPWCLGYWLGNGSKSASTVTAHCEDADAVAARYEAAGHATSSRAYSNDRCAVRIGVHGLLVPLRELGALGRRWIPPTYLRASPAQRLALLRGLMDSDGSADYADPRRSVCEWSSIDPVLVDGFLELARSLGMRPTVRETRARLNGEDHGPHWRVHMTPHINPFELKRKSAHWTGDREAGARPFGRTVRAITGIERLPDQPTRCITVSAPSGMFLAGEAMVPTHNSTATAALALWRVWRTGGTAVVISPTQAQSSEIIRKARGLLQNVPELGRAERDAQTTLQLPNGGRIVALPGSETSARGYTASAALIIDEAAFVDDQVVTAVRPTLAACPDAPMVCLSTPNGRAGWFFDAWTEGGPEWHRIKVDHTKVSRLSDRHIREERASMTAARFRREYECEFIAPTGAVFDPDTVSAAMGDTGLDDLDFGDILSGMGRPTGLGGVA